MDARTPATPSARRGVPLLDRIAAEDPNPALLQIQTPASQPPRPGDTRYALLRLQIEAVVVTDASGPSRSTLRPCWRPAGPVLRNGVLLAAPPGQRPPRRGRAPGVQTACALRRGDVRPLGLDRYGVRLRVETADGDRDVRLPFRKPVDDVAGLSQAIRLLMGCPFANGLRARRY
ncbi:hypothetical protein I553_8849 [Mycobacterium xenopi 4042]|uniref:DUF2470 domain-containing protein n=1 Tax=Mycobacterium xenopi 4042 TaxID=1299334 RepID=X8CNI4_MYCXE|nr:hypothetical protein I553_8849 [Mycobacterium xenopi 4042]